MIKREVRACIPISATLDELYPVFQTERDLLEDQAILNLIELMPRPMLAETETRRGNTSSSSIK